MDYNEGEMPGSASSDDERADTTGTPPNPTDDQLVERYKKITRPEDLAKDLRVASLFASKTSFGDQHKTLRRLGMSSSKFSKFQAIGNDTRLQTNLRKLPKAAGYSFLYNLTLLTDEQWQQGIEQGVIYPGASRREIDAFRNGAEDPKPARRRVQYFAGVTAPKGATEEEKQKFYTALLSLCERTGFELVGAGSKQAPNRDR